MIYRDYELLLDPEDMHLLAQYNFYWSAGHDGHSYLQCRSGYLHRMLLGARKGEIVDHINRNTRDNRKENLRLVTQEESNRNRGRNKNNTSGIKHMAFHKQRGKWRIYSWEGGKQKHHGLYITKVEAEQALLAKAAENPTIFRP